MCSITYGQKILHTFIFVLLYAFNRMTKGIYGWTVWTQLDLFIFFFFKKIDLFKSDYIVCNNVNSFCKQGKSFISR